MQFKGLCATDFRSDVKTGIIAFVAILKLLVVDISMFNILEDMSYLLSNPIGDI